MSLPFVIERCYDSHVHWLPTGELASLRRWDDLGELPHWKMAIEPQHQRGDWWVFFGWNPDQFPNLKSLNATDLDLLNAVDPVIVSHRDGHASVVNSAGLKNLGWGDLQQVPENLRLHVGADSSGKLTGFLKDEAHFFILRQLPQVSPEQRQAYLLKGQQIFLQAGFTHLREMMGDQQLLSDLLFLESEKKLQVYSEIYMVVRNLSELPDVLQQIHQFHLKKSKRIRIIGIKVFLDGALGSEGAALSFPYQSHDHLHPEPTAVPKLWSSQDLEILLPAAWQKGLRVAAHAIGDAGLTDLLVVAQLLRQRGIEGGLSIEHAEVVNPDSFRQMKDLDLEFHFQPSHFLTDQKFLADKLGQRFSWCFPWRKIENLGFPIFFGSDSPIEKPSLENTIRGLRQATQAGIPACQLDWKFAHSHPDKRWGKDSKTWVNINGQVLKVMQDGKVLFPFPST